MKIKKISILGFKSFMDKLDIDVPYGISGVVGPNGCGKSNIVDAIRWCLGEQSPKQLRGRRMEDVIFNGAGEQKPLGMAEVSILFENGDGSFPAPFTSDPELSVTRRLYRSGESEYRINNVPCRLKDIQEIFMDTGLGNRAYSIISQGQIGTIVEQKPEETRVMLEEAAGTTKYRRKVEASQRKIELTETNLQRIEDIQAEVQRQMRSLKRQAAKARRYKAIYEEIKLLELKLASNRYHQLMEDSGSKLKSTEDLVQQEIARSTELSRLNARIETLNVELEERDRELSNCQKKHFELRERVHEKEVGLESLSGEMKMQAEMENRLKGEQEDIRQRLLGFREEALRLEKEKEKIKGNSQGLEGEIGLLEKRIRARRESLAQIKEAYEAARETLGAGKNKEVGLNHESGYLHKMIDQITDSRSRLEKEITDAKDRMEKILRASDGKNLAREAAVRKLEQVEAAITDQRRSVEALEASRTHEEAALKSAEANLNLSQSRLASLRALTENFEGYKMGVRTIMRAKDLEPHQQGRIMGLVADVIQVAPQYEQAVEVVLADKLQYVIVESQEDGKKAVDYLKSKARGRSSFAPLRDLSGNGAPHLNKGSFPLLKDLVSAPEIYQPLMNVLLADTVLVPSLEEALSSWKTNGHDQCMVTPDGDMVDQRGIVTGGKLARSSKGILSRKREMAELKESSLRFQREVEGLNARLETIRSDIEAGKKAAERLTDEKWACQEEINELDKILFRMGQELDQSEKLSRDLSGELDKKGKEHHRHQEELLKVQEALHQCKEQRKQEESYFLKKETELKESEAEFDQLRDELARLKSNDLILKEEQRSLTREMERLDAYAGDSRARLEKIDEEIALARKRAEACRERKEALRERLGELYEKMKATEADVNRADHERQVSQSGIREEEHRAEKVRGDIEELKERINDARMEHSEIRFKLDGLGAGIREKFNLDLAAVYEQHLEQDFSLRDFEERLEHKKNVRQRLGEVNLMAIKEYEALKERHDFIKNQREDLIRSIESLRIAIKRINKTSLERFQTAFSQVDRKLKEIFPILFNGGTAGLRLTDEANPLESGVLVEVQPPGKKLSHMGLLSGGEKALVAMALLFAIYMIKPSPFCLLDEVDAPLDEANIERFNRLIQQIKQSSQVIMVTHSRRTMEITDRLFGVTMEKMGISKIVSVAVQGGNEA